MALTLGQAARALAQYGDAVPATILARLDKLTAAAQRFAVTQFMQGLGSGKSARPPNPPPGPVGIRSGNLRRAVERLKAKREGEGYTAGLALNLDRAPYAAAQEFGVTTHAHIIRPVKAKALRWTGTGPALPGLEGTGGGHSIFAKWVNHPGSRIPARPFATPAVELAASIHVPLLESDLKALEARLLGER